jgi:uncharacterized protein YdaU (DUF1376 family)
MKDRAPAFQFYPRQFAGDDQVMGMDLEAIGAHILLMCAAAASPERCRIDADEYAIRMRLRNPSDEAWQRIKKQLMAGAWKLSSDGKSWIQSGLERTFMKQKEFSDQQRNKANKKWGNQAAEPMPDSCQTDAGAIPEGMPKVCSSSASSSSNLNPVRGNFNECQTDAGKMPEDMPQKFNSIEVARALCSENGWSGEKLIWAFREAIDFKAKQMPEASLEEVGIWLVRAYVNRRAAKGDFAGGPQKFFEQALYREYSTEACNPATNVLLDNPATRALAQMEGD